MDVRAVRSTFLGKLAALEDRGRDHIFYYLTYDGRTYRGPKMSHSWRGDLNDQQIDWLKKPLELTKGEFETLVACDLTGDDFFVLWASRKGLS